MNYILLKILMKKQCKSAFHEILFGTGGLVGVRVICISTQPENFMEKVILVKS